MNNVTETFTTPEVNGTFNGFCGGCAPMTDANSDGIWELTIPLNAGSYEYKFAADSWNIQENLTPGSSCTVTNFGFTNRAITVAEDVVLDPVCWASCTNCNVAPASYDVTFQVDMNQVTETYSIPEVNGTFNGFCGGCAPMTDANSDGIWELTIPLNAGSYEYKFAADSWNIQENLTPGSSCTVTNFGFTNRAITVAEDVVLDPVCWASCTNCNVAPASYDVTFQVDMNQVTETYSIPEINGTFNGFCGGCAQMTDDNGDGIYQITITLEEGSYEYKFAADSWNIQEEFTPGGACTVTNNGFTNRFINVTENITLSPVCWASCEACITEPVGGGIINLTFDEEASITVWSPIADATLPESYIDWSDSGVTTGAMLIAGSNTSSSVGRAYIYQYVDGNVDFNGASSVELSFDVKLASPLVGAALHMQTEIASTGTINTFDLQNQGINESTWTTLNFTYDNIGAGNLFRIHFNIAAGAFEGAGGMILIDNIAVNAAGSEVFGCMDPLANNYNSEATMDDSSCLYNVTFHVNMSEVTEAFTTPEINGTFNGFCGGCAQMTDEDGDGVWSITVELAEGNYEYKFAADSWNIQENLTPGLSCTVTNGAFTNRSLQVSGAQELPIVCWASCTDCGVVEPTYNVTFRVDMSQVTEAYTTPEVNGIFNGWCGGCAPLSDVDGDNIWELTVALNAGTYEYKFAADSWNIQENLTPGSECTLTTGSFTNRLITVSEDIVLDPVCWGSCAACGIVNGPYNVTFKVDMSQVDATFTTPEVNGIFNGWCGGCAPMSDVDGDNIWELTIPLNGGTYEYKFAADSWGIQEELTPNSSCTLTTGNFTNRLITVEGEVVLDEVCWASCEACTVGLDEATSNNTFSVYPNPSNDKLFINGLNNTGATAKVRIFNTVGSLVSQSTIQTVQNPSIDVSSMENGVYFIEVEVLGVQHIQKVMIQH